MPQCQQEQELAEELAEEPEQEQGPQCNESHSSRERWL